MVLYCEHQLLGVKKKTFLHLSLGKADAFTLESHICVKTKMQGFPNNWMPY